MIGAGPTTASGPETPFACALVLRRGGRVVLAGALVTLAAVLSLAPAPHANEAVATANADQIHLSWKSNPKTTMTVTWHTATAASSTVQYGLTTSYGDSASGKTFASTGSGSLHETELTGLQAGKPYHYRVRGDSSTWSGDRTFLTAPSGSGSFRFMAAADMGTPKEGKHQNSVAVSNAMAARTSGLAFTAGAGDYWYALGAGDEATVDKWFNQNEGYLSRAPFMPSFGNHEKDTSKRYYTRLALPPPENYYSFRYGNAHFVHIDTNVSYGPGSSQRSFIESSLRAAEDDPTVKWIFVVFHHPPFASSSTYQDLNVRHSLSPLFDSTGVDLVITGHAHFYERTYPVRADGSVKSTNKTQYTNPGAPIYVVTGGGGADPRSSCSSNHAAWSLTCKTVYEFLEIQVSDSSIQFSAIEPNGSKVDSFSLNSSGGGTVTPSPSPTPSPSSTPSPSPTPAVMC